MAHFDAVTELPNRNLLFHRLDEALKRSHHDIAILYVDLNKFKPINDELGHDAGDQVLRFVTEQMTQNVRQSDTVARVGGDEFVVLLENVDGANDLEKITNKILLSIAKPIAFPSGDHAMGPAMGIALHPLHGEDRDTLMKSADQAMYLAMETGKTCYMFSA